MNELRQIHNDGSQSVLSYREHAWYISLTLSRRDGGSTLVGLMSSDLDEAKAICRRVLQSETSHICNSQCKDWQEC